MKEYQFLHLEDDPFDAELVRTHLEDYGISHSLKRVADKTTFVRALDTSLPDLIISDYNLKGFDGIAAFQLLQERDPSVPFLLVSGALGESRAVECLKMGMTDYILKDQLDRLPNAVQRALRESQERRERKAAENSLRERQQEVEDLNQRLQRAVMESHHRIKNNLQVLLALIDSMRVGGSASTEALIRLSSHIRGLATLHDLLTHQTMTPGASLDSVSAKLTLERLVPAITSTLYSRPLSLQAEEIELSLKQVGAISLLVNELVSNAMKHGTGAIQIFLSREEDSAELAVCNEGDGFPEGFDPATAANVGLDLVESIGKWDLEGDIVFENTSTGACVRVKFPITPKS
ncbi:MAG: response regulator [Armatimonas sp.]